MSRRLILYDWHEQTAHKLETEKKLFLDGFTDRLFYFCPLVKGWAVIGLQEKYLSPATVRILACSEKPLVLDVLAKGTLNV